MLSGLPTILIASSFLASGVPNWFINNVSVAQSTNLSVLLFCVVNKTRKNPLYVRNNSLDILLEIKYLIFIFQIHQDLDHILSQKLHRALLDSLCQM